MVISVARFVLARGRSAPDALVVVAASAPFDPVPDCAAACAGNSLLVADTGLWSAIATGSDVVAAASSIFSAATDPARARGLRRRGWRSPLRAGLFAPPLSTFAALFACLLVCCLAIVVFLWIRIAPVAMRALPQARRSGPGGRRPRRVRRHGQQCFLCRGSRAQCEPRQRFFALRRAPLNAPARSRPVFPHQAVPLASPSRYSDDRTLGGNQHHG